MIDPIQIEERPIIDATRAERILDRDSPVIWAILMGWRVQPDAQRRRTRELVRATANPLEPLPVR